MATSKGRPGRADEDEEQDDGSTSTPKTPTPRCGCGYAKGHVMISPVGEYSFRGWFMLLFGISALPHLIRYQCRQCQQTVAEVTDADEIRLIRLL